MSEDFQLIILGFLQAAFTGSARDRGEPDFDAAVGLLNECESLQIENFLAWPLPAQDGLQVLLEQLLTVHILAEERGEALPIRKELLEGSSPMRLNGEIVAEILYTADDLRSLYQHRLQVRRDRGKAH